MFSIDIGTSVCLVRSQNVVDNVTSDYSEKQVSVDIDFWNRERLMSYLSNIAFTDIAAYARGKKNKRVFPELFLFYCTRLLQT